MRMRYMVTFRCECGLVCVEVVLARVGGELEEVDGNFVGKVLEQGGFWCECGDEPCWRCGLCRTEIVDDAQD